MAMAGSLLIAATRASGLVNLSTLLIVAFLIRTKYVFLFLNTQNFVSSCYYLAILLNARRPPSPSPSLSVSPYFPLHFPFARSYLTQ